MNLHAKTSWLFAAGLGALIVAGSTAPALGQGISIQFGRGDRRIDGQRFTTMRALAHRLDEASRIAARGALNASEARNRRMQQRFLWEINGFARMARSFHERMDRYDRQPWDVADEVASLNESARQVEQQLRSAGAFPGTYQDWGEVRNSLNLMNRSLRGQNVTLLPPPSGRGYQSFDETYRYGEGRHYEGFPTTETPDAPYVQEGYLTGNALRDFQRLADRLDAEANRMVSVAEGDSGPQDRDRRSLVELRRFAQSASDLNRNSGGDAMSSYDTGATVGRMMDDARRSERAMREGNLSPWVDWTATIQLLEQMSGAVPRS